LAQDPDSGYTAVTYHNHASNSDVLVYDNLEWVSYMTDTTKETRTNSYKSLNFGGVSDWAVDLDRDWGGAGVGSGDDEDTSGLFCDPDIQYESLESLEAAAGTVTPGCHVIYALDVLQRMLETAVSTYNDVNNGYDSKFDSYRRYMKNALPYQLERWAHWQGHYDGAENFFGLGQQYFNCKFDGNSLWEGPCPVPNDVVGNWHVGYWDLKMTLRDSAGFDATLADLGIDRSWVEFGEYVDLKPCVPTSGGTGGCQPFELTIQGFPKMKADWESPNPKDIMDEVKPNLPNLEIELVTAMSEICLGTWEGSNSAVVGVLSMPILMMA
jgi:chitinase